MNTIQSNIPGIYALVGRSVADVERDLILETLKHCLGNRTRAANLLGISIRTVRNKLNKYGSDGVYVPAPTHQGGRMARVLTGPFRPVQIELD
jgi:DNA-binding NtrC family response regulator